MDKDSFIFKYGLLFFSPETQVDVTHIFLLYNLCIFLRYIQKKSFVFIVYKWWQNALQKNTKPMQDDEAMFPVCNIRGTIKSIRKIFF